MQEVRLILVLVLVLVLVLANRGINSLGQKENGVGVLIGRSGARSNIKRDRLGTS